MSLSTDLFSRSLARHYSHFDVENRLLFTGHSHQAWPDAALEGLIESFDAAARAVDTKWDIVFEKVDIMRQYLKTSTTTLTDYTRMAKTPIICLYDGCPDWM